MKKKNNQLLSVKADVRVWRSQTTPVLRLPPELLRMRTVKDIKVNAFVFVYRSHTYPPRLRWEQLSIHRILFGFILWNKNILNASSLITRVRSDYGGIPSTGEGWDRHTGVVSETLGF